MTTKLPAECKALTKKKEPCKNPSMKNCDYCYVHSMGRIRGVPWYKNPFVHFIVSIFLALFLFQFGPSREKQDEMLIILQRMQHFGTKDYDILNQKYPKGYFLFASNKYTVIPSSQKVKSMFTLDWESSKVQSIDNSFVYIILKKFHYNPNDIEVENLNIVLERKIGSLADGIYFDNIGLFVELLDDRKDEIIYLVGFKDVDHIPKYRELKSEISNYIKKHDIGAMVSAIDANVRKHIKIRDWTISSGWENQKKKP